MNSQNPFTIDITPHITRAFNSIAFALSVLMTVAGFLTVYYFFTGFETTIKSQVDQSLIHNQGLLNDRICGMLFGIFLSGLGMSFIILATLKSVCYNAPANRG